jgi:hypothetical protein
MTFATVTNGQIVDHTRIDNSAPIASFDTQNEVGQNQTQKARALRAELRLISAEQFRVKAFLQEARQHLGLNASLG